MKPRLFAFLITCLLLGGSLFLSCTKQAPTSLEPDPSLQLVQEFEKLYNELYQLESPARHPASRERQQELQRLSVKQGQVYLQELQAAFDQLEKEGIFYTQEEIDALKERIKNEVYDEEVLAYNKFVQDALKPRKEILDQLLNLINNDLAHYYPEVKGLLPGECHAWLLSKQLLGN